MSRSIYTGALAVFASANSITVRNLSLAFDLGAVNTACTHMRSYYPYQQCLSRFTEYVWKCLTGRSFPLYVSVCMCVWLQLIGTSINCIAQSLIDHYHAREIVAEVSHTTESYIDTKGFYIDTKRPA